MEVCSGLWRQLKIIEEVLSFPLDFLIHCSILHDSNGILIHKLSRNIKAQMGVFQKKQSLFEDPAREYGKSHTQGRLTNKWGTRSAV